MKKITACKNLCFFTICIIVSFTLQAQLKDSIAIAGIPHKLFWENSPVSFSNKPDSISIVAGANTDMFRDPGGTYNTDNTPKLLFIPDSNFVLSAGIHHNFISKWDGGAIILKADSLHWIKFCFEKDYTGARRVVTVVTHGTSDDCNSVAMPSDKVFYKIAKAGNVITLYCSENEKKWFLVRHIKFEPPGLLKIGFLAQSPEGKSCKVIFSHIQYTAKKIKDPYTGE